MNKSAIYIVGAVALLGGGAYLFLKNKKEKDAKILAELGGATSGGSSSGGSSSGGSSSGGSSSGGSTSGGSSSGGSSSGGITPNLTEPVKIQPDLNLDTYNLQKLLQELKDLENDFKNQPKKVSGLSNDKAGYKLWLEWYTRIGNPKIYDKKRQPILEKLAKFGYKFDNGLLVKI